MYDIEPVRRTVFRFQDCPNPILVAEEYDPAFVADWVTLDSLEITCPDLKVPR